MQLLAEESNIMILLKYFFGIGIRKNKFKYYLWLFIWCCLIFWLFSVWATLSDLTKTIICIIAAGGGPDFFGAEDDDT